MPRVGDTELLGIHLLVVIFNSQTLVKTMKKQSYDPGTTTFTLSNIIVSLCVCDVD